MKAVLLGLLLLPTTPLLAQSSNLFKCTDVNGRVEYRELPVSNADCVLIRGPGRSSVNPEAALEELRGKVQNADRAREEADRVAQVKAKEKESCDNARKNLEVLKSGQPVTRKTANGETVRVPPEDFPELITAAEKQIGFFCQEQE